MRDAHHKLSKRYGDKSFEDLVNEGYVVEAIVNYIALLGWSPSDNVEIFTLKELEQKFDMAGLSKSPSIFDIKKLTWMNSEYLKAMDFDKYFELARPKLEEALAGTDLDLKKLRRCSRSVWKPSTISPVWWISSRNCPITAQSCIPIRK